MSIINWVYFLFLFTITSAIITQEQKWNKSKCYAKSIPDTCEFGTIVRPSDFLFWFWASVFSCCLPTVSLSCTVRKGAPEPTDAEPQFCFLYLVSHDRPRLLRPRVWLCQVRAPVPGHTAEGAFTGSWTQTLRQPETQLRFCVSDLTLALGFLLFVVFSISNKPFLIFLRKLHNSSLVENKIKSSVQRRPNLGAATYYLCVLVEVPYSSEPKFP